MPQEMPVFVQFQDRDGAAVWINPMFVARVTPTKLGPNEWGSLVLLASGELQTINIEPQEAVFILSVPASE